MHAASFVLAKHSQLLTALLAPPVLADAFACSSAVRRAWLGQYSLLTSKTACSCGAMTHKTSDCLERPRKVGAKWTSKFIAPDEKIETIHLESYDARRDRWNGYDSTDYVKVMDR